jgi:ADP-ribose pyrophosphatase YjhB (NUDIX family)
MGAEAMSGWLEAADWKRAQETVPIACVDIVPIRLNTVGVIEKVGLIWRQTPHQGLRWCVVGGRLWRNESLAEAIGRQLRETLGEAIEYRLDADPQPDYVVQYFTTAREIGSVDPRQHALTLNFCIVLGGEPEPRGEAIDFRWFERDRLPPVEEFGFGQERVVAACLAARDRASVR